MRIFKEVSGEVRIVAVVVVERSSVFCVLCRQKICGTYSVARKSNLWPLTLFCFLLNVSGINPQIIFQANIDSQHIRRDYLKLLSLDLV